MSKVETGIRPKSTPVENQRYPEQFTLVVLCSWWHLTPSFHLKPPRVWEQNELKPRPPSWRGMRYQFNQSQSIFQDACQEQPLQSESWGDKLYSPLLVTAPNHNRRSWGPFSVCSLWTPLTTWPALQLVWITWQLGHPILSPRSLSYGFYKFSTITNHRNTRNLLVKDPGVSMSLPHQFQV